MIRLLTILSLLILSLNSLKASTFNLDKKFIVAEGMDNIEYYLSTDTEISPQERYFQMKNSKIEKVKKYLFFTTRSQKWLFFKVYNPQDIPFDFLVEMGNFGLNQADYFIFYNDTIIESGSIATRSGLKTSEYYDRNIVIPYTAQPHREYTFLISIQTNAPIYDMPLVIWNKHNKFVISQGIELGRGLFYGVLLFFVTITGFIVFLIRDRSNVYYWLYLFSGSMLLFLKSGIPLEVFWPGRSYVDFIMRNFFLYFYLLVTLKFLKEFLSSRIQSGWHTTLLDIFMVLGFALLILYIPATFTNVILQDSLLIIQMIYVNITNLLVLILLFWSVPKVKDKVVLIISLLYYFLFSAYLFNPFIEFGFWTGKLVGHFLLYTGGFIISLLLLTLTSLRMRAVILRNQEMKYELRNLNKIYSHSLVEGQEKQRKRVAEELHDGIGALLSAMKMKISALKTQMTDPSEIELIDRVLDNLDESTHQVREMSHELMPPTLKRYGLEAALVDMSQKYQLEYPIKLNIKASLKKSQLDLISETIIYRLMHQLVETLVHGHTKKADIRIVVLPSVSMATIQVKYSGGTPVGQNNTSEFIDLKALIDLLQGKIEFMMSSIWDDELNIEIPIKMSETFELEK